MESLLQLLRIYIESPENQRIIFVLLAAVSVFVLALGLSFLLLGATDPVRRRLHQGGPVGEDKDGRLLVTIATLVGPVSAYVLPKQDGERSKMLSKLAHAGFRGPNALELFYALKTILAVGLPVLVFVASQWMPQLTADRVLMFAMIAGVIGLSGPNSVLNRLLERRLRRLRNAFPDALDLLVVCVESGLGLSAAIERVAEELGVSHPELALELALVNAEIRAGVEREKALKNLAERTGLPDIRGLVSLLVQTMRFGTSIADALRIYSEEFRDRRMQQAEEQAAKISTKLIFPLVLCIFPSFFLVAVGPAVIRLINVFQSLGVDN